MCLANFGAVLVAVTLGCDAAPESTPPAGDGASDGVESAIQDASDGIGVDPSGEGEASGTADSHADGEDSDSGSPASPGAGLGPMAGAQSAPWANRAHSTRIPRGVGLSFAPAEPDPAVEEPPVEEPPVEEPPAEDPPAEDPPPTPQCVQSDDCADGEYSTGDFCAPLAPGAGDDGCAHVTFGGCPFPRTPLCDAWLPVDPATEGLDPAGGPYVACAVRWIFDAPYVAPTAQGNIVGTSSVAWYYDTSKLEFVAALPPACTSDECKLPIGFPTFSTEQAQLDSGWNVHVDAPTNVGNAEIETTKAGHLFFTSSTAGPAPLLTAHFDESSDQIVGNPELVRLVFRPITSGESAIADESGFPGVCAGSTEYVEETSGTTLKGFETCYSPELSAAVFYRDGEKSAVCSDTDNDGVDDGDDCYVYAPTKGGLLGEICGNQVDDNCNGEAEEGCSGVCVLHSQCQAPAINGLCDPGHEEANKYGCVPLSTSGDLSCETPDHRLCTSLLPLDGPDGANGGAGGAPLFACPLRIGDKGAGLTAVHHLHLEVDLPQDDWAWVGVYKRSCTKPWCPFEPVFNGDSGQAEWFDLGGGVSLKPTPAALADWGPGELVSLDLASSSLATTDPDGAAGAAQPWAPYGGNPTELFALVVTPTTWPPTWPPTWQPPCVRGVSAQDGNGQGMTVQWKATAPYQMIIAPTPICQPPVCSGASCPAEFAEFGTPCGTNKVCAAGTCQPVAGCQTDLDCEDADAIHHAVCALPVPGAADHAECVQEPWLTPYCPAGSVPLCTSFEPFDPTSTSFAAGEYIRCTLRIARETNGSASWNGDVPAAFQMDLEPQPTEWEFVNIAAELCFGPVCFWAPVAFPEGGAPASALPTGFVVAAFPKPPTPWIPGTKAQLIAVNYSDSTTPSATATWDPQTQLLTGDPTVLSLLYRNPGSPEAAPAPPCVSKYIHASGLAKTLHTQWVPEHGLFVVRP